MLPAAPKADSKRMKPRRGLLAVMNFVSLRIKRYRDSLKRHRKTIYTALLLLLAGVVAACSTRRNTALTRAYHRATARFNFYFNAQEAYDAGVRAATTKIHLDYGQPLPFVITGLPAAAAECGGEMDRAVEKCAALIRLHSITAKPQSKEGIVTAREAAFLKQNEFNPWARRAWLLMGKARLWSGEYDLAQQALEFAAGQFKDNYEGWEAQLWLARLSALRGDTLAASERLRGLDTLSNRPDTRLSRYLFAGIYSDLLVASKQYERAERYGEEAVRYASRGDEQTRCRMALASIYETTGKLAQARDAYASVAKKANSYEMSFNAKIKRIALDAQIHGGGTAKGLEKMLRDEKNVDYYNQIYYALGEVTLAGGDTAKAMEYFGRSAAANGGNALQKGTAYLRIANYHLDKAEYLTAAQFYDSALAALPSTYPNYEAIGTRGRALGRLAEAVQTVAREDSLQRVASMPKDRQLALIDGIINSVLEEERMQRLEAEKEQRDRQFALQNQYRGMGGNGPRGQQQGGSGWYFYNPSTLSFGRTDFKLRWGTRKLEDNWRRKNKQDGPAASQGETPGSPVDSTRETDTKKREYYLQDLPTNDSLLQLSNARIAKGYRQMGDAYRYDLKALAEAIKSYESCANRFAESDDAPELLYLAYATAQEGKDATRAEQLRNRLLQRYPKSSYALRISDPNYMTSMLAQNAHLEALYDSTLTALREDRRREAKRLAERGAAVSRGSEFAARFELLQALAAGSTAGSPEQLRAIKDFATKAPSTPQARYAQEILNAAQRQEAQGAQRHDSIAAPTPLATGDAPIGADLFTTSKGVFWVTAALPSGGNIQEQKFSLISFCIDWNVNLNLEVYESTLNESTSLLTVKEFEDEAAARAFAQALDRAQPIEGVRLTALPISPENFEKMATQRSFSGYLSFYRSHTSKEKK